MHNLKSTIEKQKRGFVANEEAKHNQMASEHADHTVLVVFCEQCGHVLSSIASPRESRIRIQTQTADLVAELQASTERLNQSIKQLADLMIQQANALQLEFRQAIQGILASHRGAQAASQVGAAIRTANELNDFIDNITDK